jgi:hypothetical protein
MCRRVLRFKIVATASSQGSGTNQFAAIQAVAPPLRVEVTPVGLRDAEKDALVSKNVCRTQRVPKVAKR